MHFSNVYIFQRTVLISKKKKKFKLSKKQTPTSPQYNNMINYYYYCCCYLSLARSYDPFLVETQILMFLKHHNLL